MLVYSLIFPNGKKYIGCTTAPLKRRIQEHIQRSKRNYSSNLYKAFRKHKFKFELKIIKECSSKEEMLQSEKNYIKKYCSNNKDFGYNMTVGGEFGHCGHIITEKRRLASKNRKLKAWKNGKLNHLKRPLINLDTGEYYESVADASRKLDVTVGSIIITIKKEGKVKGFFLCDYNKKLNIKKKLIILKKNENIRQLKRAKILGFKIICLNNNKVYNSYPEASKNLGISSAGICKALKNKKSVKGFTFKFCFSKTNASSLD